MPISSDDASWWAQLAGMIVGGFACFVGGIVSATWVVSSKVHGFDRRLAEIERHKEEGLPEQCATTKELLRNEMKAAVQTAIDQLHQSWGVEIAGAREQRRNQEKMLKEVQDALIRLHERIDDILLRGTSTGREVPR